MRPDIKNAFTGPSLGHGFAAKQLGNMLMPDETVLVVTVATHNAGAGIAAVTSRRVVLINNIPGAVESIDIPIEQITSANPQGGMMSGSLVITAAGRTVKAKMRNKSARELSAKISEAVSARSAAPASGPSAADQLSTYADLLDRGLISREEFDAKKAELL